MTSSQFLRSDHLHLKPGDDYLCLIKHPAQAQKLLYTARHKGAKHCFSWHDFNMPWHTRIEIASEERNDFIDNYYRKHPPINTIAITGTNGKTSTVCLLQGALEKKMYKSLLISTIGMRYQCHDDWLSTSLTTPDYADIRAAQLAAYQRKCSFFLMEASSHALDQKRLGSLSFLAVGSTAITFDDHLEYHKNPSHYLASKARLFTDYPSSLKVMEFNNPLLGILKKNIYTLKPHPLSTECLKTQLQYRNIALASGILERLRIPVPGDLEKWVQKASIKGRFEEFIWSKNRTVFVDFAHSPEALRFLLEGFPCKRFNQLWLIFGCGGQRDRSKRYLMMKIAETYANHIVITADNPRHEPFDQIVRDMCSGADISSTTVIQDRKKAIAFAYEFSPPGSLIVIAGKGHEQTQVIGTQQFSYSDLQEVQAYGQHA